MTMKKQTIITFTCQVIPESFPDIADNIMPTFFKFVKPIINCIVSIADFE